MIVVRVELHSARTGEVTEIARLHICRQPLSQGPRFAYDVRALRGRGAAQLDHGHVQRRGVVTDWPAEELHVWNLVQEALSRLNYGRRG